MGNITFGREDLNRLASSLVVPWDLSNLQVITEDVYLTLDKYAVDIERIIPAKEWHLHESEYNLVENPNLDSTQLSVFISINDAYYTLFHDLVPFIYKLYKHAPDTYFIIHNPLPEGYGSPQANTKASRDLTTKYIENFLDHLGVKYIFHNTWDDPIAVRVSRRIKLSDNEENLVLTLGDVAESMKAIKDFTLTKEERQTTPYRKVYLSRTHLKEDRKGDLRIDSEEVVEEYFRAKGYEILIPETRFSSFEEQIKYFNEVRILVGMTGTGLANGFLMQGEQFVVDLAAELAFSVPEDDPYVKPLMINSEHYAWNSYMNNQYHILVPSKGDPQELCRRLDSMAGIISL